MRETERETVNTACIHVKVVMVFSEAKNKQGSKVNMLAHTVNIQNTVAEMKHLTKFEQHQIYLSLQHPFASAIVVYYQKIFLGVAQVSLFTACTVCTI